MTVKGRRSGWVEEAARRPGPTREAKAPAKLREPKVKEMANLCGRRASEGRPTRKDNRKKTREKTRRQTNILKRDMPSRVPDAAGMGRESYVEEAVLRIPS